MKASAVLDPPPTRRKNPLAAVEEARPLFDEEGRFSAKKIAELYDVPMSDVARWLGKPRQSLSNSPTAAPLQKGLGELVHIAALRHAVKDDAAFRAWLRMPNSLLENESPLDWIGRGRRKQVAEFVHDILAGNFS